MHSSSVFAAVLSRTLFYDLFYFLNKLDAC